MHETSWKSWRSIKRSSCLGGEGLREDSLEVVGCQGLHGGWRYPATTVKVDAERQRPRSKRRDIAAPADTGKAVKRQPQGNLAQSGALTSAVAQQMAQLVTDAAGDEIGDARFVQPGKVHRSAQYTTAVRNEVGQADNAPRGQQMLRCRRDGIVGAGTDSARTNPLRVSRMHAAVPSARAKKVDRKLKELGSFDTFRLSIALDHGATSAVGREGGELGDVQSLRVVECPVKIRYRNNADSRVSEERGECAAVPVHSFETPIRTYATMGNRPI
jgi:hypothetical protein